MGSLDMRSGCYWEITGVRLLSKEYGREKMVIIECDVCSWNFGGQEWGYWDNWLKQN